MALAPPPLAALLGAGGLIPFVAFSQPSRRLLPLDAALGPLRDALGRPSLNPTELQVTYGCSILSFLGAPHWGWALAPAGPASPRLTAFRLLWGVTPALLAWPCASGCPRGKRDDVASTLASAPARRRASTEYSRGGRGGAATPDARRRRKTRTARGDAAAATWIFRVGRRRYGNGKNGRSSFRVRSRNRSTPAPLSLDALSAGLLVAYGVDAACWRARVVPRCYLALRTPLTFVAVASLQSNHPWRWNA